MGVRSVQCVIDTDLGERKDKLKNVTWMKIIEDGIKANENKAISSSVKAEDKPLNEPVKVEKDIEWYLKLEKEDTVLIREFDVLKGDMFMTVPLHEIMVGNEFRVRDDGKVLVQDKIKLFKRIAKDEQNEWKKDGFTYFLVKGVK